jgi:hypothetical protein
MRTLTAVMAAALVLAASGTASEAARSTCWAAGAKSIVTTSQARVYERADGRRVACSYREGRHVVLDTLDDRSIAPYAVNHHYVASLVRYCVLGECAYWMAERSLSTGRARFHVQNRGSQDCDAGAACDAHAVGRVLMKRNGSLTWIACEGVEERCASGPYAVLRRDARDPRVLDRGPDIDVQSLRINRKGTRVLWSNGGEPRYASLR